MYTFVMNRLTYEEWCNKIGNRDDSLANILAGLPRRAWEAGFEEGRYQGYEEGVEMGRSLQKLKDDTLAFTEICNQMSAEIRREKAI